MADTTTIKVPKHLRETVTQSARNEGLTSAAFLELVIEEHARRRRFEAVRAAYASAGHDDYDEISSAWDHAAADGLDDD